ANDELCAIFCGSTGEQFIAETAVDEHLEQQQQQEDTGEPGGKFIQFLGAPDLSVGPSEATLLLSFGARWRLAEIVFGNVFWVRQGGGVYRWVRLICHGISIVLLTHRSPARRRRGRLARQLPCLGVLGRAGVA